MPSPCRLRALIVCRDDDTAAGSVPAHQERAVKQWLDNLKVPSTTSATGSLLLEGSTLVVPLAWRAPEPPGSDLPDQQSLERLVFAAVADVYPSRTNSVRRWLKSRPDPFSHGPDHRASAGALWAGWYAGSGWGYFFEGLWKNEAVRDALILRMRKSGTWDRLEEVFGAMQEPSNP